MCTIIFLYLLIAGRGMSFIHNKYNSSADFVYWFDKNDADTIAAEINTRHSCCNLFPSADKTAFKFLIAAGVVSFNKVLP
jgi:hypothetical protein